MLRQKHISRLYLSVILHEPLLIVHLVHGSAKYTEGVRAKIEGSPLAALGVQSRRLAETATLWLSTRGCQTNEPPHGE